MIDILMGYPKFKRYKIYLAVTVVTVENFLICL